MAKKPTKRTTVKKVQSLEDKAFELPDIEANAEVDDAEDFDSDGLTLRRRAFVEHITGRARGNASRAAELAGFAAENRKSLAATASRLLSNVNIQQAIASRNAALRITPEAVTNAIAQIACSDMSNFLRVDAEGKPFMDWAAAAAAGAIGQVKEFQEDGFEASDGPTIIKRKFKTYDRLKALELLARMNGQLIDRVRHEGEVKFNPITLDGDKDIGHTRTEAAAPVSEAAAGNSLPGSIHGHRSDDKGGKDGGLPHLDIGEGVE